MVSKDPAALACAVKVDRSLLVISGGGYGQQLTVGDTMAWR